VRRIKLVIGVVALMAAMLVVAASPAVADDWNDWNDFCNWHNCNNFCDWNDCNNGFFDTNGGFSQSNEQDVESGDAWQAFNVNGGGDNSNQIAGVQGVNNTGNAVSNTSVFQGGSGGSDVDIDGGGNFTISPSQWTGGSQQVNQSAATNNHHR
jgi:hypothetical protein